MGVDGDADIAVHPLVSWAPKGLRKGEEGLEPKKTVERTKNMKRISIAAVALAIVATACSSTGPDTTSSSAEGAVPVVEESTTTTSTLLESESAEADEAVQVGSPAPLVSCADLPRAESSVQGVLPNNASPNDLLLGVLYTYADENPDTFAGLWIDRDNGGAVVVAFTDDIEPHRVELNSRSPLPTDVQVVFPAPEITDTRTLGERVRFVFDVVQLEFTEAELVATQDELSDLLLRDGTGVFGVGLGTIENRVSLFLVDPSPEELDTVARAVDGLPACVEIQISPEPPSGPLNIIPEPGEPLEFPPGLAAVGWRLDPAFPRPQPADTEIHILATELGCANGRDPGENLRGPQVVERDDVILIAFAVVPVAGPADCPGNPETAVTVTLDSPVGDRALRNGANPLRQPDS